MGTPAAWLSCHFDMSLVILQALLQYVPDLYYTFPVSDASLRSSDSFQQSYDLQTKIRLLTVLSATGVSLFLGPPSRQT